jgi:hypothetical protein
MQYVRLDDRLFVMRSAAALLAVLVMAQAAAAQAIVKQEPPSGALRRGTVILVDDGSCPAGQIKEVSAGAESRRTRRCVPRR